MNSEWKPVVNVKITEEEIQAALAGKPLRKSYYLKPDLTVLEKTLDESADPNQDTIIATIELVAPAVDEK